MKMIIAAALLVSFNALAVDNCKLYGTNQAYAGQITEESRELSFNNCPESLLVNEKFVAQLFLLKDAQGKPTCGYRFGAVAFTCENN